VYVCIMHGSTYVCRIETVVVGWYAVLRQLPPSRSHAGYLLVLYNRVCFLLVIDVHAVYGREARRLRGCVVAPLYYIVADEHFVGE
jgi:hypothetical protein